MRKNIDQQHMLVQRISIVKCAVALFGYLMCCRFDLTEQLSHNSAVLQQPGVRTNKQPLPKAGAAFNSGLLNSMGL
jgi:hypothetical protein